MQGATVVCLTSGANMNFDRLRLVADLANFGQRTEAMLTLSIPERSGEFLRFVESLYDGTAEDIGVTECKYRYSVDRPAKMLFSLAARSPEEVDAAVERLRAEGYACRDVTKVPAAQVHLRHMVGGRPRSYTGSIDHEKMVMVRRFPLVLVKGHCGPCARTLHAHGGGQPPTFRTPGDNSAMPLHAVGGRPAADAPLPLQVMFPEKVGALRKFLQTMAPDFNVTMFHYRATGNRMSSALLGLQVPPEREGAYAALQEALAPLDYTFEDLDTDTQHLFDEFIS